MVAALYEETRWKHSRNKNGENDGKRSRKMNARRLLAA
jgi:hypothetical protein